MLLVLSPRAEPRAPGGRPTLGSGSGSLWPSLATEGGRDDLRRKMEEVSQVLDPFIGEVPVKMAPGKLLFDIPTRLQRL